MNEKSENQFSQFRTQLYHEHFNKRADTLLDLVDAISSNSNAHTLVALSLNPCFRRDYTSLFKAVADYEPEEAQKDLAKLAAPFLPQPKERSFYLLGIDVTSVSRPSAFKLTDRGFVYQPNVIKGNKPITIGHQYSDICALPENSTRNWIVPLNTERVRSSEDKALVGARQVRVLLEDEAMPFFNQLCAEVADSDYSKPAYLSANRDKKNLVTIVRVRSNRIFYRQPEGVKSGRCGHPSWYGTKFSLRDPDTRPTPDETASTILISHRGKKYRIEIQAWDNMLMRGKCKKAQIPMQNYPFTLVRVSQYNEEGDSVFANPMWLIVIGEERRKLSLLEIYKAYRQRYDVEHFFRFGKQKMLLDVYQTPETEHEEKWWDLVHLAYLQLWVAKEYAANAPRPWERYLPSMREEEPSPAMVQRSFDGIIRQFGTPACFPKPRGKSPGRQKGMRQPNRERQPIIRSG